MSVLHLRKMRYRNYRRRYQRWLSTPRILQPCPIDKLDEAGQQKAMQWIGRAPRYPRGRGLSPGDYAFFRRHNLPYRFK